MISLRGGHGKLLLVCCLLAIAKLAFAQAAEKTLSPGNAPVAEAVPVDHPPRLDGSLDDPLWQKAKPITDFRQREPFEGKSPTEKTEVRILYTKHAVYFGIHCSDSEPQRIVATELRRDVS